MAQDYQVLTSFSKNKTESPTSQSMAHLRQIGQKGWPRRFRIIGATLLMLSLIACTLYSRKYSLHLVHSTALPAPHNEGSTSLVDNQVDWSRFAYVQYVTNAQYLCNSVMLFEILNRLGSKADRLMMYPAHMHPDPASPSKESRLLLKAQKEYNVKLMPIEVQRRHRTKDQTWADSYTKLLAFNQTQYSRLLSLDSDSTVLQTMDELFLLPSVPVAMPRAYWLDKPYFSNQIMLIEPSAVEFKRVKDQIDSAAPGDFDMEIINNLYGKDCHTIPHRPYGLLTREFRSERPHQHYLGNGHEEWDPEKVLKEAKFLHFSDWPAPKPWLPMSEVVRDQNQPKCIKTAGVGEDCRARDLWLGFYRDFQKRREEICDFDP